MICSGKSIDDGCPYDYDATALAVGVTLAVVELVDIRPLRQSDTRAAMFEPGRDIAGLYAWVVSNPRRLAPIKVSGALGIFGLRDNVVVAA